MMELELECIASLASIVIGVNNRDPPLTALLISLNSMPWRNFSKFTVVHANGSREPNHTRLGMIYHSFGNTSFSFPVNKI